MNGHNNGKTGAVLSSLAIAFLALAAVFLRHSLGHSVPTPPLPSVDPKFLALPPPPRRVLSQHLSAPPPPRAFFLIHIPPATAEMLPTTIATSVTSATNR